MESRGDRTVWEKDGIVEGMGESGGEGIRGRCRGRVGDSGRRNGKAG